MKRNIYYIIMAASCCLLSVFSCVQEDIVQDPNHVADGGYLQLNMSTEGLMNQFVVTTRGTDVKTPEEQEIKSLHIFIFDTDGNYLETADQHRFQSYRSILDGKTVMNIDREGWADESKAQHATVVAVANVKDDTFVYGGTDAPPTNVTNLSELENFIYRPTVGRYITTQVPEDGMPMYARMDNVNLTSTNAAQSIDIPLKALMARIDVSLQINSEHSDVTGSLPQLTVTGCRVLNVPLTARFGENTTEETNLSVLGKEDFDLPLSSVETIQNGRGVLEYTFYTFENLQEPGNTNYQYPVGILDDEKQQYKPELADKDNSLAFQFSGNYITYNGASYEATYTLYLGANHTNDFKVMRNKQYKNNVTIKGIVKAGNNPEHITFDTRVNITETNPYFISMLKDRTLDSHFNVVSMDVYFFQTNPTTPVVQTMKVEIVDPSTVWWVRMEKIPASEMESGTVHAVSGGPELLATGKAWYAGNGKRKYFTTDLVTSTLVNNTSVEITDSRDRIYFYVDENLDVWHLGDSPTDRTRTATVQLTYYEDGQEAGHRTLVLEQAKLLEVIFHDDEDNGMSNKRIYIEAYEEYLDHGDPLNEYENNQVFTGLPWQVNPTSTIGNLRVENAINLGLIGWQPGNVDCYENYYWGHDFTQKIVEVAEEESGSIAHLDMNSKPKTAAGYCYMKNKRNANGGVNNPKWYLPGIRELERILERYYIEYPEFQQCYYWSSAAGQDGEYDRGILGLNPHWSIDGENQNHARATKAYIVDGGGFAYYPSSMGDDNSSIERPMYEESGRDNGNSGRAYRTTSLRIRAARIDNNAQ